MEEKVNRENEKKYMLNFIQQCSFDNELSRNQLRCLWTAYCFHHRLDVDTLGYDHDLIDLWNIIEEKDKWIDFDIFDNFMCKYLV